ncbi:MAG: hypothetical protein LBD18_05010, partial [Treponema sp.]|nr:hypothetical protein [Treponema sp.]
RFAKKKSGSSGENTGALWVRFFILTYLLPSVRFFYDALRGAVSGGIFIAWWQRAYIPPLRPVALALLTPFGFTSRETSVIFWVRFLL